MWPCRSPWTSSPKVATVHSSSQGGIDPADALQRRNAAAPAPPAELRDVDSAAASFAIVNPGLRLAQAVAQLPLRQFGLFTQGAKELRNGGILRIMLGLGRHTGIVRQRKA